jgi:hypothetical protein
MESLEESNLKEQFIENLFNLILGSLEVEREFGSLFT